MIKQNMTLKLMEKDWDSLREHNRKVAVQNMLH